MLSPRMEKAINDQINAEFYSAYFYLSMVAHFEAISLVGFANWMRIQVQEEMSHGMKMYDFVLQRGGRVILQGIAQPPAVWDSSLAVFRDVLAHEQKVTGLINNLANIAQDERDHATTIFLQWFVTEQVEEEDSAKAVVDKLTLIGNDANGLFMLDQELAKRVFTPPAP